MITWDNFYLFAVASICLWLTGAIFAFRSSVRSRMAVVLTIAGITCLGIFIAGPSGYYLQNLRSYLHSLWS